MVKDMTKGSPMKLILGFSVPLLFGFLFQQFYDLVDTVIVGRFLGTDDLADAFLIPAYFHVKKRLRRMRRTA